MSLLYGLLAACAALIAVAFRWKGALIPALICVGIVAYVGANKPDSEVSSFTPKEESKPKSIEELPPQYELVRERTLSNGARIVTLQKNYSVLGVYSEDGEISTLEMNGSCTLYVDPDNGISTALDC